jgi:hypothetical protein
MSARLTTARLKLNLRKRSMTIANTLPRRTTPSIAIIKLQAPSLQLDPREPCWPHPGRRDLRVEYRYRP